METIRTRPVVYQMMTRLFGNTKNENKVWGTIEDNGVGKLNDITLKALQTLKNQGYTHIWFTGVIEHALLTDYTAYNIPLDDADVVKGRAGSPYAIKDYFDINPDLAVDVPNRLKEFESLVKRTHQAELKVILDFVPNHVARSYKSDMKPEGITDLGEKDNQSVRFSATNNFYYIPGEAFEVPADYVALGDHTHPTKDGKFNEIPAKVSGNDVFKAQPAIWDWFETVKLNYGVDYENNRTVFFDPIPDTWLKMKEILSYWASKGVDGFRCDMAEMVPVQFWQWAINELKKEYPEIVFIAEIYNPAAYREYIYTGGFDYLYDKVEMYDTLKHIIQNRASTDDISAIWQKQEGIEDKMLRFLENHDEQRIASPDFAGDATKGIPMMAVSAFMHKGPVMMYFGQDVGEPGAGVSGFSGDDGRTTIFDYWGVPEHIKWVNNGQFDGGQLSEKQKELQNAYIEILQLCNQSEAIRSGGFFDLHYYNRNEKYTGYSNRVYAFLRYKNSEVKLIVINLGDSIEKANIKIPQLAWESINIVNEIVKTDYDQLNNFKRELTITYNESTSPIQLELNPYSYKIIGLSGL